MLVLPAPEGAVMMMIFCWLLMVMRRLNSISGEGRGKELMNRRAEEQGTEEMNRRTEEQGTMILEVASVHPSFPLSSGQKFEKKGK